MPILLSDCNGIGSHEFIVVKKNPGFINVMTNGVF